MSNLNSHAQVVTPRLFGAGDRVQDDQKLVHAGHQRDLLGLASGQQLGVEALKDRVEARADQGCDIEHSSHVSAPAEDVPLASQRAGVAIHRCQPYQSGDLLAVELPQLGQLRQQRAGRDGAYQAAEILMLSEGAC